MMVSSILPKTIELGDKMNENDEVEFEKLYTTIRGQFDELAYKEGINPMHIFGVYLGIMAQEFKEHASKEDFDKFLTQMLDVEWTERTVM